MNPAPLRAARLCCTLALTLLLASASLATPPSDPEAVRQAVLDYVEGLYEGDPARIARSVSREVSKRCYTRPTPESDYGSTPMTYDLFLGLAESVRKGHSHTPENAPREILLLDVQDQTASAKLTAWWGTEYLLLAREGGQWKITHVLMQSTEPGDA